MATSAVDTNAATTPAADNASPRIMHAVGDDLFLIGLEGGAELDGV
jgi:hypothetical protein